MVDVKVEVSDREVRSLVSAFNREVDARELKDELVANFRAVAEPTLVAIRGSILSMESRGYLHESLRGAIAANTEVAIRLGGRKAGVQIRAMSIRLRSGKFNKGWRAARRTDRPEGWGHPVFGQGHVEQIGKPGWFEEPILASREAFIRAARLAVDEMVERIKRRART